jgi:hypothetical protein
MHSGRARSGTAPLGPAEVLDGLERVARVELADGEVPQDVGARLERVPRGTLADGVVVLVLAVQALAPFEAGFGLFGGRVGGRRRGRGACRWSAVGQRRTNNPIGYRSSHSCSAEPTRPAAAQTPGGSSASAPWRWSLRRRRNSLATPQIRARYGRVESNRGSGSVTGRRRAVGAWSSTTRKHARAVAPRGLEGETRSRHERSQLSIARKTRVGEPARLASSIDSRYRFSSRSEESSSEDRRMMAPSVHADRSPCVLHRMRR